MDIDCPPLASFSPTNWAEVRSAFADSPPVHFQQFWRETPEENFSSGVVRTGWSPEGVWVYAVLEDREIFNDEKIRNSFFFLAGDVFEIFVRPDGQDAYFEFHVGPTNQQMQMRIPSAEAFATQSKEESKTWKIEAPLLQSWVQIEGAPPRWEILAFLPFTGIVEGPRRPRDWWISFSRYDYTRGKTRPVLSSTSPHAVIGFHRQEEWRRLRFQALP